MEERIKALEDRIEFLEKKEKAISKYCDYLAENFEKVIGYAEYLNRYIVAIDIKLNAGIKHDEIV